MQPPWSMRDPGQDVWQRAYKLFMKKLGKPVMVCVFIDCLLI